VIQILEDGIAVTFGSQRLAQQAREHSFSVIASFHVSGLSGLMGQLQGVNDLVLTCAVAPTACSSYNELNRGISNERSRYAQSFDSAPRSA
jgi:hypothetical protein